MHIQLELVWEIANSPMWFHHVFQAWVGFNTGGLECDDVVVTRSDEVGLPVGHRVLAFTVHHGEEAVYVIRDRAASHQVRVRVQDQGEPLGPTSLGCIHVGFIARPAIDKRHYIKINAGDSQHYLEGAQIFNVEEVERGPSGPKIVIAFQGIFL